MVHSRQHNRTTYPCETCGKKFTKSSSLKDHMRVHTGEKPFACAHCSKTFTTSGTRNKHYKRCSGQTTGDAEDENTEPGSEVKTSVKTVKKLLSKSVVGQKKPPVEKRKHICSVSFTALKSFVEVLSHLLKCWPIVVNKTNI